MDITITNPIDVTLVYLPTVNFSMQQNRVAVVREFSVTNSSENPLQSLDVSITVEPEFASFSPVHIERINAKETVRITDFNLSLSADFFAQLTERFAGNLTVTVTSGEELLFKKNFPIDVLAFDQWSGVSVLPEMLSAFVMPNHPAIAPIIRRAATILESWTGNASLDEYQSRNPDRVRKQMAAVYAAIAELDIIYSTIPASFESFGQRIRLPDVILSQRLGTCIDLALLYASCLEAIGIHPLIVITQGHAFAGGWLIPETFPDNVIDDVSFLTKRTAAGINEITLVETTGANQGKINFDEAVKAADATLLKSEDFVLALDVKRTRFSGIRPLPQRVLNGQQWEIQYNENDAPKNTQQAPETVNPYDLSGISTEIELTKQLMWERKLLDLSLRNNLLNIRVTKNTLQLIAADLDRFEDALANGDEFSIFPKPSDWDNPLYEFGLYHTINASDPTVELIKSELSQKRLRAYLDENELKKVLVHLYRSSRLSIEENGANTLYLALGLLRWYETPSSERPRYAPILLLPVEIIRKSAAKGYVIRSREEDAMMNITLLEMLRQNFGIVVPNLDQLPTDESGVDVRLIYSIIRNSIREQRKWDVEEQVILGIFSFNKFIMWNDIHNNADKLIENKYVSSLINGKIEWELHHDSVDAADLDKHLSPKDLVLPINADSSQLEAIYEAVNEKSFILHGPPGTGKSQTITNIIANALYKGKRVLFVAEKMAALSVVQSRLEAIGLAPFCLELHSNKAKKSAVLAQLKTATEVLKLASPEAFAREANRLHTLRSELGKYVDSLHKKYVFGLSLYEAISRYFSVENEEVIDFPKSLLADATDEKVENWRDAVESLISTVNAFGHPFNHPLADINIADYSTEIKETIARHIREMQDVLSALKPKLSLIATLFGSDFRSVSKRQIEMLPVIIEKLLHIPELTPTLLTQPRLNEALQESKEVVMHGKERDRLKNELTKHFSESVLLINADVLLNEWNQAENKWFIAKFLKRRSVKKELKKHALQGKIQQAEVVDNLNRIIRYQKEKVYVDKNGRQFPAFFGKYGKVEQEDWNVIEQIIRDAELLDVLILGYAKDIALAFSLKESLAKHVSSGLMSFKNVYQQELSELAHLCDLFSKSSSTLLAELRISEETFFTNSDEWMPQISSKLDLWLQHLEKLKDWYRWLCVRNRMESLGIRFVADTFATKPIAADVIMAVFDKSFYKACIEYIISMEPDLEFFKGQLFNDTIRKYKELAERFETLTKKELFAKLASNVPSFTVEAAQNSEVGILQRNIRNNGRGVSIRRLFDQIPTLLSRMCPCMLMSPISVAQYIDIDADKFDLIVFDEASQMPTYEAVGAIARGKNIVIVGDPKQMPPTNFFTVNIVDEDNIEMEDLESILDDCLALSMPSKYLLWHYRSKHESLIAFSNFEYYENKLLTFPSPDNIESKVRLVPIDGFYDKGKSRRNKAEAQAVVDEIVRRLENKTLRKKSIGVVTFSIVQQSLIEELLSDFFIFHPHLERWAYERDEPLFIKNLENVQGDERDVILFSVGYGPDASGKVSMNFGPLNRAGGERRLNVAVSRARYEMIIYSTLRSDHIDLNRTSAVGVAGLKRFLEYTERGEQMIPELRKNDAPSVSIVHAVAEALRKQGYVVHTNIGYSGYKIDMGVVDEEAASGYLLGILCDGENYKQTKTVRDREIVQNSVLRALGWNIYRVWTMDWWESPQETLRNIVDAIEQAKTNKTESSVEEAANIDDDAVEDDLPSSPDYEAENDMYSNQSTAKQLYRKAELTPLSLPIEAFYAKENKSLITSQISDIIEKEAPVSRSLISKRILSAWDIARMGVKIDRYLDEIFNALPVYRKQIGNRTFFWHDVYQCQTYADYRPLSDRDAADLPPEEIANAMKEIVSEQVGLPTDDLIRITAQLFGFSRRGSNLNDFMLQGLQEAVKRDFVKIENDKVVIN